MRVITSNYQGLMIAVFLVNFWWHSFVPANTVWVNGILALITAARFSVSASSYKTTTQQPLSVSGSLTTLSAIKKSESVKGKKVPQKHGVNYVINNKNGKVFKSQDTLDQVTGGVSFILMQSKRETMKSLFSFKFCMV